MGRVLITRLCDRETISLPSPVIPQNLWKLRGEKLLTAAHRSSNSHPIERPPLDPQQRLIKSACVRPGPPATTAKFSLRRWTSAPAGESLPLPPPPSLTAATIFAVVVDQLVQYILLPLVKFLPPRVPPFFPATSDNNCENPASERVVTDVAPLVLCRGRTKGRRKSGPPCDFELEPGLTISLTYRSQEPD